MGTKVFHMSCLISPHSPSTHCVLSPPSPPVKSLALCSPSPPGWHCQAGIRSSSAFPALGWTSPAPSASPHSPRAPAPPWRPFPPPAPAARHLSCPGEPKPGPSDWIIPVLDVLGTQPRLLLACLAARALGCLLPSSCPPRFSARACWMWAGLWMLSAWNFSLSYHVPQHSLEKLKPVAWSRSPFPW